MSYSVASLANAIIKLEKDVATLANTRNITYNTTYNNDLTTLKSEFEKLNSMIGLIQISAQTLVENKIEFDAWKQSSNVWRNILDPIAKLLFIDGKFENGLTRTAMYFDNNGKRYAKQGGNTLCGDVYELVVIYKNGLAKNIIPNINLPELWNSLYNILLYVETLGESVATSSYAREVNVNGAISIIQTGTIGGYQKYEDVLTAYCKIMYQVTNSILNKISDIRIGGIGSEFGTNKTVAINQCNLTAGVSLNPYNTSFEIFSTVQPPLTVVSKSSGAPFNNIYNTTSSLSSFFQFIDSPGALLGLYTNWNPFCPSGNIIVHNGLGTGVNLAQKIPHEYNNNSVVEDTMYVDKIDNVTFRRFYIDDSSNIDTKTVYDMKFGKAFGLCDPQINTFDSNFTKLTYKATEPISRQEILNIELYFEPTQGSNTSVPSKEGTELNVSGNVTGKIIAYGVGFNFVGYYANVLSDGLKSNNFGSKNAVGTTTETESVYNEKELIIGDFSTNVTKPSVLYQLGGYMYYA